MNFMITRHRKNTAPENIALVNDLRDIIPVVFNDGWNIFQTKRTALDKTYYTVDQYNIRFDTKNGWSSEHPIITKVLEKYDSDYCGC